MVQNVVPNNIVAPNAQAPQDKSFLLEFFPWNTNSLRTTSLKSKKTSNIFILHPWFAHLSFLRLTICSVARLTLLTKKKESQCFPRHRITSLRFFYSPNSIYRRKYPKSYDRYSNNRNRLPAFLRRMGGLLRSLCALQSNLF